MKIYKYVFSDRDKIHFNIDFEYENVLNESLNVKPLITNMSKLDNIYGKSIYI